METITLPVFLHHDQQRLIGRVTLELPEDTLARLAVFEVVLSFGALRDADGSRLVSAGIIPTV